MDLVCKTYRPADFEVLVSCMENLQDFLVRIDPFKRLRRTKTYGKKYTENLLRKVKKMKGLILLAWDGEKIAGCIAGILEKQSSLNLLECVPARVGRVIELFVAEPYRRRGVGKQMMREMENYFKKKKCDVSRVEVFEPNKTAHHFYSGMGYQDRMTDLFKLLDAKESLII